MKQEKQKLRLEYLNIRNELKAEEISQKSTRVIGSLKTLKNFEESRFVMCYVSFGSEVETRDLIAYCIEHKKRIAVPLVVNEGTIKELWACEIYNPDEDLEPGTYGILEPKRNRRIRVSPKEIDMVIVPGVVFDRHKQRIGYGAGYYDRFLLQTEPNCSKVGIAFDFQLTDDIPAEDHDIPLDWIVTENRVLY